MIKKVVLILLISIFILKSNASAITYVRLGDTGSMILPVKNSSLSAGNLEGVTIGVSGNYPEYFSVITGSQTITPGNSYSFQVNYAIPLNAVYSAQSGHLFR